MAIISTPASIQKNEPLDCREFADKGARQILASDACDGLHYRHPQTKEHTMFVVRDIFQLKFGQSKEATALWKQGVAQIASKAKGGARLLTDVAGAPYYTIILESTWES